MHLRVKNRWAAGRARPVRGSAMIELALFLSVAAPLLLSLTEVGLRLGRGIQATQVTRDVGHMYALGADFTLPGTQSIAQTLAGSFTLTGTGTAVLMFSRVQKIQQIDCTAAGLSNCPNLNQPVFTQRIVVGNAGLRSSAFGTPPVQYIGDKGMIASSNYCKLSSLVASGFDAALALQAGQSSWMVEGFYAMPELNVIGSAVPGGMYVRLLF